MGLSNYQLVLLDNLIYVESIKNRFDEAKEKSNADQEVTLGKIISGLKKDLENAEQEEKEKNPEKSEILLKCDMSKQEWFGILDAIAGDDTLKNLVIHNIQDNDDDDKSNNDNGFRAMTLVGADENIIIFRGTSTNEEWIDNGQGFSNELFNMPEYRKALEMNGDKLYMIASAREPVNILFNTAVPEDHRMYIAGSPEDNIFHYHKPNNVLAYETVQDSKGNEIEIADRLRETAPISSLTYVLKDFVRYMRSESLALLTKICMFC